MSETPHWAREATAPRPDELTSLRAGLDPALRQACAQATDPDDHAVSRLQHRAWSSRRRPTASLRGGLLLGGLTLAGASWAAVSLGGSWGKSPSLAAPSVAPMPFSGTFDLQPHQPLTLGPQQLVVGLGRVTLNADAEGEGTLLLEDGAARFEAGPVAPLHVGAAGVHLVLEGRVRVTVLGDQAGIWVEAGSVWLTDREGARSSLTAGDSWSGPPAATPTSPDLPEPVPEVTASNRRAPRAPTSADGAAWATVLDLLDEDAPVEVTARAIDRFLLQFPTSPLRGEAEAVRLSVDADTLPPHEAIRRIDAWIVLHPAGDPGSARRLELLELRATLARDRLRDCALALPTYRLLVEEATDARQARAWAYLGICARAEGLIEESEAALRAASERASWLNPALRARVEASAP